MTTLYYSPAACSLSPHIALDYYERIEARPKVREALQAEGLLS